jgi:YHS domain-containing protein
MNIITNPDKLRGIEGRIKVENVSRRSILKGLGIAGGLVLAAPVMSRQALAAYKTGAGEMPHGTVVDPRVFVAIASDGTVSIVAHRAEMGTGVRTSLPLIVAEEMEADWSRVKVAQAPGDEVKFGNQDTDGSRSTRHYLIPMRQIGASARTMLEGAAAKRWGVPATEVKAANHEVIHSASGRRLGFGDLAADAAKDDAKAKEKIVIKCPVSGESVDSMGGKLAVDFEGGKVFFCCDKCPPAFKKDPTKYIAKAHLQMVQTNQLKEVACPFTGKPLNPETAIDVGGVKVAFCCKDCMAKAAKAKGDEQIETGSAAP